MRRIFFLDLQETCQFGLAFFLVSLSVPKLQRFEMVRAINIFETASTVHSQSPVYRIAHWRSTLDADCTGTQQK